MYKSLTLPSYTLSRIKQTYDISSVADQQDRCSLSIRRHEVDERQAMLSYQLSYFVHRLAISSALSQEENLRIEVGSDFLLE
jgi:hypothetical protein